MIAKKEFFKRKTAKQIMKDKELVRVSNIDDLAGRIEGLKNYDVLVVETNIIPGKYYSNDRTAASRKFLKHGPEVKPKRYYSLESILGKVPVKLREGAFNSINGQDYSCYSFRSFGNDRRKRRVSLVQCVEGAKLYNYAHNSISGIDLKSYDRARRVAKEGSDICVEVPSRRPKEGRERFKLTSVPIVDSPEKYTISCGIGSDHSCDLLRYKIRYRFMDDKESSRVLNFCAHEIAAYLKIIDELWNKEKNIIPMQMSWFAIPTQETVDYYNKALNQVVVEYNEKTYAPLNQGEMEIALWSLVNKKGHDKTFFAKDKVVNYKF